MKYCIIRKYHKNLNARFLPLRTKKRVVRKGLSFKEAVEHCKFFAPSLSFHGKMFKDEIIEESKCLKLKGYKKS